MAKAIDSGSATMPTITPATRSRMSCSRVYPWSVVTSLGMYRPRWGMPSVVEIAAAIALALAALLLFGEPLLPGRLCGARRPSLARYDECLPDELRETLGGGVTIL